MPATYENIRKLALAYPGVTEGNSYGSPSLHVGKKLLGRLREDLDTAVLNTDHARRDALIDRDPEAYFTTDHYREHPWVLINLATVKVSELPPLVETAWRMVASKRRLEEFDQAKASGSSRP